MDAWAEQYVIERSPSELADLILVLGDRELNQLFLDRLRKFSVCELKIEKLNGNEKEYRKLVKKENLRPAVREAMAKGWALEAEVEFCSELIRRFPGDPALLKHLVDLSILGGDHLGAMEEINRARRSGRADQQMLGQLDRSRSEYLKWYLEKNPGLEKTLNELFEKLKTGRLTPEGYEAIKSVEIGIEFMIDKCLRLLSDKRFVAYRTILKLSELADNGLEARVNELKFGIFGRIINDAIKGEKLTREEAELLNDQKRLLDYSDFNPVRFRAFIDDIKDVLSRAQNSRVKAQNEEVLQKIYDLAMLKSRPQPEPERIEIEYSDGEKQEVETEDDCLDIGLKLISLGRTEEAMEMARKYPGFAGYELEVTCLLELGKYDEARARFAETRYLLECDKCNQLEKAVSEGKPLQLVVVEDQLKYVIRTGLSPVEVGGRRYKQHGYDGGKLSLAFNGILAFPSIKDRVFKKLAEIFVEEARSIEGLAAALGFIYGQLKEIESNNPEYSSILREGFSEIFPSIHEQIMRTFRGDPKLAEAMSNMLVAYSQILQSTYNFKQAAEAISLLVPEEKEREKLELRTMRFMFLLALNLANSKQEDEAIKMHLRLARLFEGARTLEEREAAYKANRENDYVAQNYALLANLFSDKEQTAVYLENAMNSFPRSEPALCSIATALVSLGREEEAESFARKAYALNHDSISAIHDLTIILMRIGRAEEATEVVMRFINDHPEASPMMVWTTHLLFLLSVKHGIEPAKRMLEGHREVYAKEKMAEFIPSLPGFMKRRLSPEFILDLGLDPSQAL